MSQVTNDSHFPVEEVLALSTLKPENLKDIYDSLKFLLQSFYTNHSYLFNGQVIAQNGEENAAGTPLAPSPQGKATPQWAKQNAELVRIKSGGMRRLSSTGSGNRKAPVQRRKSNLGPSTKRKARKIESDTEEEEDDPEAHYSPKKHVRSRRRLEADL